MKLRFSISNANKWFQLPLPRTINFNIQIRILNKWKSIKCVAFTVLRDFSFAAGRDSRALSVHLDNFCWSSTKKNRNRREEQWKVVKCWWWINCETGTSDNENWSLKRGWGINWFQRYFHLQWHFKPDKRIVHSEDWIFFRINFPENRTEWHDRRENHTNILTTSCETHYHINSADSFIDGDVMKEMVEKEENPFEWVLMELHFEFNGKAFTEKLKNLGKAKRLLSYIFSFQVLKLIWRFFPPSPTLAHNIFAWWR